MSQQCKVQNANWAGLPYVVDGILCLFGAVSLGFLIGLTEEFHHQGAGGDAHRKQLAPVLVFVAFAQACELADRIWRLCCRAVTKAEFDKGKEDRKRDNLSVAVLCGCLEECFADDEKSPRGFGSSDDNEIDQDEGCHAPARVRYRCELPLQSVKRGRGEYRIAKVRQVSSVAVTEDLDPTPRASEFNRTVSSAYIAYEADRDTDFEDEGSETAMARPGWTFVDECDGDGV